MKKLLTVIASCIVVCILFSSCDSNTSIVKRHYTKGYYVEHIKRVQTVNSQKEEQKIAQNKKISLAHPIQYISKEEGVDKNANQDITNKPVLVPSVPADKKMMPNSITQLSTKPVLTQDVTISESPVLQTKQVVSDVSGHYGYDGGGERAALSLLWIVIVVILILWLIGILAGGFGLGGLINVLLIIALILLILWLLRVW